MKRGHGRVRFLVPLLWLGTGLATGLQCKSKAPAEVTQESSLKLEILSIDPSAGARDGRPFVAGEEIRITLRLQGGVPPYELQLATATGSPALASASTRLESTAGQDEAIEVGMDLRLGSEAPSGAYDLLLRVTDNEGVGASVKSEVLTVIGRGTPLAPPSQSANQLQIVDVAGRARPEFYQGEEIQIRARVSPGESVSLTLLAADERPFMPTRQYQPKGTQLNLPMRIPRLARVGSYRVLLVTGSGKSSVPFEVVGKAFAPVQTPILEELRLLGGKDFRVPRKAGLRRGETLRIESRVGGIHLRGRVQLRLRTGVGQVVAQAELGEIVPSDPHPAARTMLSATWTPDATLTPGRHNLELEITEGDEVSTIYREIVLR